jgi:epsilon-lactone hydrolase
MASEELKTVLELVRGADLESMTIAERRAVGEAVAPQPPAGTLVESVDAGGVPAEWVVAAGVSGARVLLYLHGGAYQMGSPATLRHMIALISAAAGARVLSVGYRLAPEHPFPAAVEDTVAAYRWLRLRGLPPMFLLVGDAEVLLDDCTRVAARAREAGVAVTLEVWDEMPHVWPAFAGLLPEADQAIARIGSWLSAAIPACADP